MIFRTARFVPALLFAVLAAAPLPADIVDTNNGAHLVGKIIKIDSGVLYLRTTYAGDIAIKQSEVATFSTDGPVAVRFDSGTRLDGVVTPVNGRIRISGIHGIAVTEVRHLAAGWTAGGEDPAVLARRGHWAYEAGADIEGKSGNNDQLGTDFSARADHKTTVDELQFYGEYNRQITNGQRSTDMLKGGGDYSTHFAKRDSWYVRDEAGFDHVMNIRFYDTAATGYGYDMIKQPKHTLTGRAGIAYRYDSYIDNTTPEVNSIGGDFELLHDWTFTNSHLVNKLTFVPAFAYFNDYIATHETYYEIPLLNPHWKLRLGVANDYNNAPGPGIKRLDTTYYTRLLLDWQ